MCLSVTCIVIVIVIVNVFVFACCSLPFLFVRTFLSSLAFLSSISPPPQLCDGTEKTEAVEWGESS